jgi:glutaredoxin
MHVHRNGTLLAFLLILALTLTGVPAETAPSTADRERVSVTLFYTLGCPHCTKARRFLSALAQREPRVRLQSFELTENERIERAFTTLSREHGNDPPGVPMIIAGESVFIGYGDDTTSGAKIEEAVRSCFERTCRDPAASLLAQQGLLDEKSAAPLEQTPAGVHRPPVPESVSLPGLGDVSLKGLSLPLLTVVLAAIDGFNPCAMWVLVFLIGLLIGMRDPFRMWLYGSVFLLTSGAVYFVFLAAWLNAFLLIGALPAVRTGVGIFALIAGAWYLSEFWRNPEAACKVTSPGSRAKMMDRLGAAVAEPSRVLALLSIMGLAVAVNMIELLCSAGVPAVYTQILAMSELSTWGYYAYLMLYIVIFMLDDALIFVLAMVTLRQTGLMGTYARYSHLIGGIVLLGIGAALIMRPELLALA